MVEEPLQKVVRDNPQGEDLQRSFRQSDEMRPACPTPPSNGSNQSNNQGNTDEEK